MAMAMPHHQLQAPPPPDLQQQQQQSAVPDHRPPPVSQRTRGPRTTTTQRRRQALEQEVAELKQQLSNEQTVHDILERALQQQQLPMSIPAFIPAKAKELLAELVLVEEEIARLENHIHTMKKNQQACSQRTTSCCMMMQQQQTPLHQNQMMPSSCSRSTTTTTTATTAAAAETTCNNSNSNNSNAETIKSMFFISQAMAMDGEYLSSSSKVKSPGRRASVAHAAAAAGGMSMSMMMTSPKNSISYSNNVFALPSPRHSMEKHHHHHHHHPSPPDDVALLVDANNINRPPTNTNTTSSSTTKKKTLQHHHHELPFLISTNTTTNKSMAIVVPQQQQQQPPPPNKLSERIVKCLVCIFIRLLRSSRVAEMAADKSSSATAGISLHQQQQAGMGSFRMDTALSCLSSSSGSGNSSSSSSSSSNKQRGGGQGQQDHYGIFGIPDAIVRDIGPYKNLVRFTSTSLDLRGFSTSPLLTKLRNMLEALQRVDLRQLTHNQKLAFWLNVYNTCIMNGILQHGVPSNPDKLLALKNKATINVSGQQFNALVIENFILRQPSSVKEEFWRCDVDVEEQAVREVYGLKTSEPNILFALCCGIRSSPALRIYKADRVSMDLDKAKLEYLQASLVVTTTRRVMIPSLMHSSMHDFAKDMESLVRWICEQLPTSWSLRKSMVECLLSLRGRASKLEEVVEIIPFDYDFQYLLPMM